MKFLEKIKGMFIKKDEQNARRFNFKLLGFIALGIGNVVAITITTVAWFALNDKESKIQMVSGDLDVEINKVTAYKYVYPYYKNSTEFIDYDSPGTVKKYALEDHTISYDEHNVDEITISSDKATITLGTKFVGTSTTTSENASPLNVYLPTSPYVPEFRYYLIGDDTFCGVEDSWHIESAFAFGLRENVTNERKAIIDNVVVSAGSSFTLIDAMENGNTYSYHYFPIDSIAESASPFRIIDSDDDQVGDTIYCLRSGIYTFTYSPNQLEIELRTSDGGQRKDYSVIINNSLDPTKISIDYAGSVNHSTYPTIDSYVPTAIFNQYTTLILDVELNFKNTHPVDVGLEVNRLDATSNSIYNTPNKYQDTVYNRTGYVDKNHVNPLRASDFYNYYAKFKQTPYASTSALWTDMHRVGDNNSQKFLNDTSYDKTIDCTLHVDGLDSIAVPASTTDNIYHCYIAIDYDYEHSIYFLDKNRLGKTYILDRDFGFHFYGIQHTESQRMNMRKKKSVFVLYTSIVSLLVTTLVLSIGLSIALFEKYAEGNGTYGEISLRSYYECGSGRPPKTNGPDDPGDPFVITRPRHLYNLSRLQGLGVYGEKTYFVLGKVDLGGVDSNGVPMCYADDSSSTQKPYLDMSGSDLNTNPINAIGSEALPFYGLFDGQNVEIKNLNVYANPQDAGLFGYTAHGSEVHNLFLSNVTIHALGYTSDYSDLYGPESDIGEDAYFDYNPNDASEHTHFSDGNSDIIYTYFYADENFEYTETGSSNVPTVTIEAPSNSYSFSSLLSGDLIKFENDAIVPNFDRLFEFFGEKKEEEGIKYPIQASSSASLIVSSVDRYGQKHSKVLLTLEYDFTLDSAEADFIAMGVRLSGDHGNNIGLIAGHCDGSIYDCYVYNGSFVMNDAGNGYYSLENGSNLGLIGLVGGTVQNILADEADVGAKEGKNIGVLDFTTLYSDIIDEHSFDNSATAQGVTGGVTYEPISTSKYEQYLRKNNNDYITLEEDAVTFRGRTIVTNTDLGVFTVATDARTSGYDSDAGQSLDRSVILTEDLGLTVDGIPNNYYIYYSTGEFNKAYQTAHGNSTFDNYLASFDTYNNDAASSHILLGHHFPKREQVTRESFETREARQNYFVRFKLDDRRGKGFYFSDVDPDTDGGAFLANYFNYKLVDQNNHHIAIGDNKCGLMLKDNLRQDISSLSASFALPDLTPKYGVETTAYCLEDGENKKYVSNMVNFEIKNEMANVTVIAAPTDRSKPSALGVYKLDDGDFEGSIDYEHFDYNLRFKQRYNNPDYAFFMPDDNHLAYFDYHVNSQTKVGEIGTFTSGGSFEPATNETDATVAREYNANPYADPGNKTRLFAHTFCLPKGRYCFGSASNDSQCVPKIFYICAQGQDDGQFDFDDTAFSSTDRVEDVDFVNVPRFNNDGTANIIIADVDTYNPDSPTDGNKLANRRLYLALVNSDRSLFGDSVQSDLSFTYDAEHEIFIISTTLNNAQQIASIFKHVAVDNYNHSLLGNPKHLTVNLLGNVSDGSVIVYPVGNQEVFMIKKKLLKTIGFLIALIPFSSVLFKGDSKAFFSHFNNNPKYLLTGTQVGTSGDFDYYAIDGENAYAVALKESALSDGGTKTIPSEYSGLPVTGIWRSGFYNSHCTSVVIPSSITVIDYEAFMGSRITTVTIPASVDAIGEAAFYSCKSLTKAVIQNSTTTSEASSACSCYEVVDNDEENRVYSDLTEIPSFCFFNCVSLKEIVLPESIEEIGYEAFNNCISLFSTLAFMNIKTIRSRAFQGCKALKKVYISSSFFEKDENQVPIGIMEDKAFDNCNTNLEFFLVGETDDITAWRNLAENANWNRKSEFSNPGSQNSPDVVASNRYTYHITAAGASYTNDWIYTVDQNNDVEITSYIGPTEIEGDPVTFLTIPNELPSGSGNKVRAIALNALDTVKANLVRLYLPTTLKRIEEGMFGSSYTNLQVIDDNNGSKCTADQTLVDQEQDLTPRIILNDITDLEVICNDAFVNMPKLTYITKLYLPYSLKAVGRNAFANSGDNKHMQRVTDFRWDYDDEKSALKVIGKEAFYKIGNTNNKGALNNGIHIDYLTSAGVANYQLTTLVIPRTFEHFGITSDDSTTYRIGSADDDNDNFGYNAFAGSPLLEKVIFKGSKKSYVQSTPNTADPATFNLVIPSKTFVMNGSLRTIVFEERCGKNITFHTTGGKYTPAIGWSSGKNKNDFGGDPALQTLVLPNKYTNLRMQNFALQGNSRGVIYLSGTQNSKLFGSTTSKVTTNNGTIYKPTSNQVNITDDSVKEWRTIGDEGFYTNTYPGYCFASSVSSASSVQNSFGINQKMPIYENIIYKDTISKPGVSTEVEVGTGNTIEYVEDSKCSFVISGGNATMTNYLYDRHSSSFTGTATVPATVNNAAGTSCPVTVIGPSAFSAAYCDTTSYKNYSNYKDLTAVMLPNTITTIGEYAFMRAYGVTKVSSYDVSTGNSNGDYVMPSALTFIDKHAFAFCNVQQVLNIPDGCVFYENSTATTYETSVFSNNFSLRKITFGNNATSSTNYTTTTYTHSATTYTSALYSTAAVSSNASSLLLVLNRDDGDRLATSSDLASVPTNVGGQIVNYAEFNGRYANQYLYGAFKTGYWIDSLTVGTAIDNSLSQPLISGISDLVYLNNAYNFTSKTCRLKSISFGNSATISTPTYSFEGCEQLVNIKLPRVVGATIPAGLFASIGSSVVFEVPDDNTGTSFRTCDPGELDLTYTGYIGIEAEAFKNSGITEVIAPITSEFTIGEDAFGGCTGLTSFDLSNVTSKVTLNASFRGATISSTLFDFGSTALIEFGDETFKNCTFSNNTFNFPEMTAEIGNSCFESCTTLHTVGADANLTHLKRIVVDNGSGKNNAGNDTGFKQIGNYAFYMCKNLASFDFSKFTELERIGHYAFGMNDQINGGVITPDKSGSTNNATICTGGVVNLPASLTNLGVGAFHSSKITSVIINSSTMKFERGKDYTTDALTQSQKGGFQFRFCPNLTKVWFTNPDCAWTTPYLTKSQGGQDNYFSNCKSLEIVNLPRGYNLQYSGFTGTADGVRPDSMIWDSKTSVKFYVHHTVNDLVASPAISDFFHRTAAGNVVPIVFFVSTNADVCKLSGSTYVAIRSGAQFWTMVNGTPTFLGTATVNSSTGLVTFSISGYTADSSGVHHS